METAIRTPGNGMQRGTAIVIEPMVAGQPTQITYRVASEQSTTQKISDICGRLDRLAQEQVTAKSQVEDRWIKSVRAYHGKYDEKFLVSLRTAKQSTVYVKAARSKTVALEARLFDLIFPTDDRNWGIAPTPVPKLADELKEAQGIAHDSAAKATQAAGAGNPEAEAAYVAQGNDQAARAAAAQQTLNQVNRASKLMQEEMDDQLIESKYPQACRKSIHDFCQLGTAILKGPVVYDAVRGRWLPDQQGQYTLKTPEGGRPRFRWVDPWSFFPDMSASCIEEAEFTFERYLWTRSDLRKLVREMGFDANSVRELLRDDRRERANSSPGLSNLVTLRSLTDDSTGSIKGRYVGWEYHGPLECEEIVAILTAVGRQEEADAYAAEDDPLKEHRVVIWFCEGQILKIAEEYPLDSGETLYSLANLEEAEGTMFGYGIPWIMMDSGDALNSAWRQMLDNGAMSVGPQMVLAKEEVVPADGDWAFAPKKIWYRVKAAVANSKPVEFFNVPNNQEEMANVITVASQFIDMETGIPQPQQGEQGSHTTQTVGGMAILQNAANIIFRRIVKNWDDGMITPSMRRLYDWNMQFSPRPEIKGDMQVDARGTSVLLVKEVQAQNLMIIVTNLLANPNIAPMIKAHPAIEKLFQAMMIKPSEVMLTEDEWTDYQKKMAETPPPPNPQEIMAQARIAVAEINAQITQMRNESAETIAELKRQTELIQLATTGDLTLEELNNRLQIKDLDNQHKERMMVSEHALEKKDAEEARARGEEPDGSGGYFSAGEEGKAKE